MKENAESTGLEWASNSPWAKIDYAVDMIAREAKCEPNIAREFLAKTHELVRLIRECGHTPLTLTTDMFDRSELEILLKVLPHSVTPMIGSVQKAIEYAVLDMPHGEYALLHTATWVRLSWWRWRRFCALKVMVGTA